MAKIYKFRFLLIIFMIFVTGVYAYRLIGDVFTVWNGLILITLSSGTMFFTLMIGYFTVRIKAAAFQQKVKEASEKIVDKTGERSVLEGEGTN